MFSLLRTPLPASAVECSLACNLVSPSETSLVTAGADVLRVFRLRPHAGIAPGEKIANVLLYCLHCCIVCKFRATAISMERNPA